MTKYIYANTHYDTEAEAEAAVAAFKQALDNNYNDFVTITPVTSTGGGSWVVSESDLTDSEIASLDTTATYNVASVHSGVTHIGVAGLDVAAKISEIRTEYASWKRANTIVKEYAPTNVDMSGYVS